MIEILTKIGAEITIIVVENREPYYFITICKCKKVPLSLFSYQMLLQILTSNEWSSYYKVYDFNRTKKKVAMWLVPHAMTDVQKQTRLIIR